MRHDLLYFASRISLSCTWNDASSIERSSVQLAEQTTNVLQNPKCTPFVCFPADIYNLPTAWPGFFTAC